MSKKKAAAVSVAGEIQRNEIARINQSIKNESHHEIPVTGRRNPRPLVLLSNYLKKHR